MKHQQKPHFIELPPIDEVWPEEKIRELRAVLNTKAFVKGLIHSLQTKADAEIRPVENPKRAAG